jgi:hypothetical protein
MKNTSKRRRRRWLAGIGVVGVGVLAFVLLYFEPQTAFIDDEVSETIPGLDVPVSAAAPASPTNSIGAALASASETGMPVIVSTGTFISGEHGTSGTALVVALPDGSVVVRFEDLDTSNGPDLRVVLSTDEASDAWKYEGRHILAELKGNVGDQNYTIPADVDLSQFGSVVVWCERFSVAFGAAPLAVVA